LLLAGARAAGAHEPGRLTSRFALDAVRRLAPYCHAMAITEVDPMTDVGDMTSTLAVYLAFGFAVFGSPEPGAGASS
jgi:formiminoglutamase/agmatinase